MAGVPFTLPMFILLQSPLGKGFTVHYLVCSDKTSVKLDFFLGVFPDTPVYIIRFTSLRLLLKFTGNGIKKNGH